MRDILSEIVAFKASEVARLDVASLRRAAEAAPAPRDFLAAVVRPGSELSPRLIAELKRASPSKGLLVPDLDLMRVAEIYAENGASAISVLTDRKFFHGALETLHELRFTRRSPLPLLRKDFVISESQLYESRANGADAVLLIVAALHDDAALAALHSLALALGLTCLVEIHNEREAERALRLEAMRLIGINNRDLATFQTSLTVTERLRPMLPADITVVSESGIATSSDVKRLADANIDAALIGEALMTSPDIAAKVQELAGIRAEEP